MRPERIREDFPIKSDRTKRFWIGWTKRRTTQSKIVSYLERWLDNRDVWYVSKKGWWDCWVIKSINRIKESATWLSTFWG